MKKIFISMFLIISLLCISGCEMIDEEEVNGMYFTVTYDYGNVQKDQITILYSNCWPFFELEDYGITSVYPGDQLYIEYTGDMMMQESYPGRVVGVRVKNVQLVERKIEKISETNIDRDEDGYIESINGNINNVEYIIVDEKLNYMLLSEYSGEYVYQLEFNHFTGVVDDSILLYSYLAFDPNSKG